MKLKFLGIALLVGLVSACSSSDDSQENQMQMPTGNFRLTADVNGERFEAVEVYDSVQFFGDATILNMDGINAAGDRVSIGVSFSELGTVQIGQLSGSGAFKDESENLLYLLASTNNDNGYGTVTITSDDGVEIKGTFEFEAFSFIHPDQSVVVTNGEFTAEYYMPDN